MTRFNQSICRYFFGDQFNVEVASQAIATIDKTQDFISQLEKSIEAGDMHVGIQLICYMDVDTGFFMAIGMKDPLTPSCISMFAQSQHRLWGGTTLVCVPPVFCLNAYRPTGEYDVYRHTFKRPLWTQEELDDLRLLERDEQWLKGFAYSRSRIGWETIPGQSYVGITRNSWQTRYRQHIEDALENISQRKFHQAIRKWQGQPVTCVHDVIAFGIPHDDARCIEKQLINESSLWPKGLNMRT